MVYVTEDENGKNGTLKKQKLRKNFCLLPGIHHAGGIGVFLKTRKNNRKIAEVVTIWYAEIKNVLINV